MTAVLSEPPSSWSDEGRLAARGGLRMFVLQAAGRLFALAFVVLVTRHLQPTEFGRYSAVAATVIIGSFLADFGTRVAMTRLVGRQRSEADALLAGTLVPSFAIGVVAYAIVLSFAALRLTSGSFTDMALGALAVPAAAVLSSFHGVLDGVGLLGRRASITALQTIVVALGAIPVALGTGVEGALVALALAPLVAAVAAGRTLRRANVWTSPLTIDIARTRILLKAAAPFALTGGLAVLSMRFDVLVLATLRSPAETAAYDLSLRLLEAGTYLSAALTAPLFILLNRRLAAGDDDGARRAFASSVRLIYLLGLPISAGLAFLAGPIVSTFLGPGFEAAATPLAIMGAAQWLCWLTYAQGSLIMAGDFLRRGVIEATVLTGVTLVLDVVFIVTLGTTGAALAMVASWTSTAIVFGRFHRRTSGIVTAAPSTDMLLPTVLTAGVLLLSRGLPLAVPLLLGSVVYALSLVLMGGVDRTDFRRFVHLLQRDRSSLRSD